MSSRVIIVVYPLSMSATLYTPSFSRKFVPLGLRICAFVLERRRRRYQKPPFSADYLVDRQASSKVNFQPTTAAEPQSLFSSSSLDNADDTNLLFCNFFLHDAIHPVHKIVDLVALFVLPLVIQAALYTALARKLWKSEVS